MPLFFNKLNFSRKISIKNFQISRSGESGVFRVFFNNVNLTKPLELSSQVRALGRVLNYPTLMTRDKLGELIFSIELIKRKRTRGSGEFIVVLN